MPRLDSDVKLDFKDVLVRPKRSTLKSRADVSTPCVGTLDTLSDTNRKDFPLTLCAHAHA